MQKKHVLLTTFFSSLLTILLLAAFFVWGEFANAQNDVSETGEGIVSPASVQVSESPTTPDLVNADNLSHWFIIGSNLLSRGSGIDYTYSGNGCIYVTNSGGEIRMQFPVILPDGSIIKSMEMYYKDTSPSSATMWLSTYDPGITSSDIIGLSSVNATGVGVVSSAEITHTVDNSSKAYSLNYSWGDVTDTTIQICGVRIDYIDPFFAAFLPATIKN